MRYLGRKHIKQNMKFGGRKTFSHTHRRLAKKRGGYTAVMAPSSNQVAS